MTEPATPPGWPADLPPPHSAAFGERVVAWLLDRGPAGFRSAVHLRANPAALARIVSYTCSGEVEALRVAYGAVRRELGDGLSPGQLERIMAEIEAQGAASAESLREVDLVAQALAGVTWRARL
jgi:hypothetical protein